MNKCGLPLALLLILITCPSAVAAEGRLRATDLRCEYRKNPVGIDTLQPRLQWKLETTDPQARAKRQTAYQILAASSEERLRRDQGDVLGQWKDQLRQLRPCCLRWQGARFGNAGVVESARLGQPERAVPVE